MQDSHFCSSYRVLINAQVGAPWALSDQMKAKLREDTSTIGKDLLALPRHHPALLRSYDFLGPESSGEGMCQPEVRTVERGWGYRITCNGSEEVEAVFPVRELLRAASGFEDSHLDDIARLTKDPDLAKAFSRWKTCAVPEGTVEWSRVSKDLGAL